MKQRISSCLTASLKKRGAVLLGLVALLHLTGFAQNPTASYDAAKHLLSVNAQNAPMSKVVDALAKDGFALFIVDMDKDFNVTGKFTAAPVDDVLNELIPDKYHFFYRVSPQAEKVMFASAMSASSKNQRAQTGEKAAPASAGKGNQNAAETMTKLSDKSFRSEPKAENSDMAVAAPQRNAGKQQMAAEAAIKEDSGPKETASEEPKKGNRAAGEHLVVIFNVTKNGIEPVSASYEEGNFVPRNENTAIGNLAFVGVENGEVVLLDFFENPLEAHAVFDPANKSEHGAFPQESGYVAVKMPKKYGEAATAGKLSLQIASVDEKNRPELFKKMQSKTLKTADITRLGKVQVSAQQLEISKVGTINRN
ncbi:MAG: hypothetical protein ACK4Q5_08170 [Saprospiraceae bacterium]